jgi:hypothetical protein
VTAQDAVTDADAMTDAGPRGRPGAGAEAAAVRAWAGTVVLGAALLFVLGGGWANLHGAVGPGSARHGATGPSLPVALEPLRGELPSPPTRFRWTPGTPGATAQLVLHRVTYEPLWSSPPLLGVSELEVPLSAYDGVGAAMPLTWRVRETLDGKPLGSSDYVMFTFRVDNQGYGPGESVTTDYLD